MVEFSMLMFDQCDISIPSMFRLSFGAIIWRSEMEVHLHESILRWFLELFVWAKLLSVRSWHPRKRLSTNYIYIYRHT